MTKITPKYQFEMVKKFEAYMRTNPNKVTERWLSEDAPEDVKEVYCGFMKTAEKRGRRFAGTSVITQGTMNRVTTRTCVKVNTVHLSPKTALIF